MLRSKHCSFIGFGCKVGGHSFTPTASMVHFSHVKELARKQLTELLDKYSGTKVLVWDESLTGPMDLIAKYQFLRDHEVVKMFPLNRGRLPATAVDNIVFVTRPDVERMDRIAENVRGEEQSGGSGHRTEFHIVFLPRKSLLCEMRLKEKGVFGSFTFIDDLPIFWYPLDSDIVSMEDSGIFRDYHLKQDPTSLHSVARALMDLQALYGVIPSVYGKGKAAKQVFDFMTRMRMEHVGNEPKLAQIDHLIIIDRQVDLISPLVSQLTYEGLIDELFGIKHNMVKLPAEKFVSSEASLTESQSQFQNITLNSSEEMYAELRDKHFNAVGPTLSRKAKSMSAQFEERHDLKTVGELKSYVEKMPQMKAMKQSLSTHTSIAEMIKERTSKRTFLEALHLEQEFLNYQNTDRSHDLLEESACQDTDLLRLLRTICLQSVVNSGLKPKVLESYRRLVLQAHGYQHLLTVQNLDKVGLLSLQQSNRNYAVLRKRLNLTLDDVSELSPLDMAYVHSVYAPLSARLVQNFVHPGWRGIRDVLDLLPGPTLEETQNRLGASAAKRNPTDTKTTLVLFVGGCTFAEISALRFLAQHEESNNDFLIATTAIINGNTFIKSLMTEVEDTLNIF